MSPARTFRVPRLVLTGSGSSAQVGEEVKKLNVRKGLIVTDRVLIKLGLVDGVKQALQKSAMPFAVFDGVSTEPVMEFVRDGLKAYRENSCDYVLAVGGGSSIDWSEPLRLDTSG